MDWLAILARPQEFIAVEVDEMGWVFGDPNFLFPGNLVDEFLESGKTWKDAYIHTPG